MFYEVLQNIMDSRNLKISEVAKVCELPDSTVRSIIGRKQKTVALEVAFKLAKGLSVSLEYLNEMENENSTMWAKSKIEESETRHCFSTNEQRLITNYRSLNEEGQEKVSEYADDLVFSGRYKKRDSLCMDTQKEA